MSTTEMVEEYIKGHKVDCGKIFAWRLYTSDLIKDLLQENEALWIHDGDVSKPHVELSGGNCSDCYVNCSNILNNPSLSEFLAFLLLNKFYYALGGLPEVDWVIGSPNAAITLAHDVARLIGVKSGFPEKSGISETGMVWERWQIKKDEKVLQIEDLVTTGGTLLAVRKTLNRDNPVRIKWFPYVGAIVHRPKDISIRGYDNCGLLSLLEMNAVNWPPDKCPLCRRGSPRIKPKFNWLELFG
ncbi:MAG: hypothetical protein ACLFTS_01145 [Candidatus Paceibacterota bacterium]